MTSGQSLRFPQRVFFVAGIYGVLALLPQYFMEAKTGRDFPPAITHPEFFYGFIGVGLAWQVLFFLIAKDPVRYRLVMLPAMLEKFAFALAAIVLFMQGRLAVLMLGAAVVDLVSLTLFIVAFFRTPAEQEVTRNS